MAPSLPLYRGAPELVRAAGKPPFLVDRSTQNNTKRQ
jgi:hypothetical protein